MPALGQIARGKEGRVGPEKFPEIEWPEPYKVPPPWEGGDGNAINEPKRKRAAKMHEMDKFKKVATS